MDDKKINELITAVAVIDANQKEYKDQANIFRDRINEKLDKIWSKLEKLPCKQAEERFAHIGFQLKGLWWVVGVVFVSVVGVALCWGGTVKQVQINSERWDRLLQHQILNLDDKAVIDGK